MCLGSDDTRNMNQSNAQVYSCTTILSTKVLNADEMTLSPCQTLGTKPVYRAIGPPHLSPCSSSHAHINGSRPNQGRIGPPLIILPDNFLEHSFLSGMLSDLHAYLPEHQAEDHFLPPLRYNEQAVPVTFGSTEQFLLLSRLLPRLLPRLRSLFLSSLLERNPPLDCRPHLTQFHVLH